MSNIFILLRTVHDTVHDAVYKNTNSLLMTKNFSIPKIYTGGVDITTWNQLNAVEKENALSKNWYLYYSFRDKETDKLIRMPNIKAGANKLKTKTERIVYLNTLRDALEYLLEKGFNPNEENDVDLLLNQKKETFQIVEKSKKLAKVVEEVQELESKDYSITINDAFNMALKIKENSIATGSYRNFELRIRKFRKTLNETLSIKDITRKLVNEYLNTILENSGARNRNNTRTDLSSLFQVLENNEIIFENFVKKINVLKSNPERNKTYTPEMQKTIYNYLSENDLVLLLFIKFISYNFLRPVEVCRLKIKDIDFRDKKLYVRAKNKLVKIKIIPEILINDLPDLSKLNPENYLFTPTGFGQIWETHDENNRRDYFSKRFKNVVKDHFKLGKDYGLYSFRHTFIRKLYREIRKNQTPFEAKSVLMLITGHSTMTALEQYLRDIDAELPQDYSHLLT